ncbi:MAG: hypothetical protein K8R99_02085 [Actinomycetia bacterium]|nr:hypothetical protein [Actinomycetes bacterium]
MKRLLLVAGIALALCGATACSSADRDEAASSVTDTTPTLLPVDEPTDPTDTVAEVVVATPGAPTVTGPSVIVEPNVVKPGERAMITVAGFEAHLITISICGNEARRGSADCNMPQSQGMGLTAGKPSGIALVINEPDVTCPCIVRVTSDGSDEIAAAPITITGHPVGPVVDPPTFGDLVAVKIQAEEAQKSLWGHIRPELGGPTPYDVTVSVKNLTTTTMYNLRVSAAVGHDENDYLSDIAFDVPEALPPGQTWTQTVRAVVKAPVFGTLLWRAAVSGAGPTVYVQDRVEHRPLLLMIGSLAAIVGLFTVIIRALVRRHIRIEQRRLAELEALNTEAAALSEAPMATMQQEPVNA